MLAPHSELYAALAALILALCPPDRLMPEAENQRFEMKCESLKEGRRKEERVVSNYNN